MLSRPATCLGCSLNGLAQGFAHMEGLPQLGVALLGEALGEQEAKAARPFIGPAGFRLERMIQRAGYKREDFLIANTISCRPPQNQFSPSHSYYTSAMDKCRQYWEPRLARPDVQVIVPLGNVPLEATLGYHGGILSKRGYVEWSERLQAYVLPTVHPSYIMRGNSNWESAFIYDLRHAVEVAADGWEPVQRTYSLDPAPGTAEFWADVYEAELAANPGCDLTCDIETPDKSAAEDETDINLGYLPGEIYRIGFGYVAGDGKTRCLSVAWDANYFHVIRRLLRLAKVLVFCNRHFDVPRLRAHQFEMPGEVVDLQEAWHVLHSDLPKKLEHMAPYLVPNQPAWKHLSGDQPAYYNAVDCGVQIEAWFRVRALLREAGMEDLYERDVRGLNPILIHMNKVGMPVNMQTRMEASVKLQTLKDVNREKLNEAASEARPSKIYKKKREGLVEVPIDGAEKYCSACDKVRVNKNHPCVKRGEGQVLERPVPMVGYAQPLDFKPSQKGMLRYVQFKGYRVITRKEPGTGRKLTPMDENAIRRYALQHPTDPLFPLVLEERELGKLLSTYVGRVVEGDVPELTPQEQWHKAWQAAQYVRDANGNRPKTVDLGANGKVFAGIEDDDIPF